MQPTHRKALNPHQLNVLYALYRFRFGTANLLAQYQGKVTRQYMNVRLRILCEQGYIGRRYDGSYRLSGKPASYNLLPKGIAVLKQRPDMFKPTMLRNIRKDAGASDRFASHCINVLEVYCQLNEQYGDGFKFFTRSYLGGFDSFPQELPDGYILLDKTEGEPLSHYMLECFDGTLPDFAMRKRIEQYVDHADSGEWTATPKYPGILLVCHAPELEKKARKWALKELDKGWGNDLKFTMTTMSGLPGLDLRSTKKEGPEAS